MGTVGTRAERNLRLQIFPDPASLADHVAAWLLDLATVGGGRFSICLSGGSTPRALYRRLAEPPYRDGFPWERTHLFWGDERFVPHDDPLSNFAMVKGALLDQVALPPENIHAPPTEGLSPTAAAAVYQSELQAYYGTDQLESGRPLFDVNFLGLGEDGHTASLFPNTDVLLERRLWVAAVTGAKPEARLTLTYPALESSALVAFLVTGAAKAGVLSRLLARDQALPAARLHPTGEGLVFSDAEARRAR